MTQNAAPSNPSRADTAPRVLVDEELWGGALDEDAAEKAAASSIAATAGRIIGAKPFPQSTRRLAELARSETSQTREMVQVLEQDPALSAKVLKIVNSAAFGLRHPCLSVHHAVTLMGSKQLYQMATTASVLDLYHSETRLSVQILRHSTLVGALARHLGVQLALPVEELFTAGVLHDIGKLMMLDAAGERYHDLVQQCLGKPDALHLHEHHEYGFDHGVLAAHVLRAWNIPEPVPKIVARIHQQNHEHDGSSVVAGLVQTIRFADALAYAMDNGATISNVPELARHDAATFLDISDVQLASMWPQLEMLRERTLKQHQDIEDEDPKTASTARLKTPSAAPPVQVPKNFPCVACGEPSFGVTCPTCRGYVCPEHPLVEGRWCTVCQAEFADFVAKTRFPVDMMKAAIGAMALVVLTMAVAHVAHLSDGLMRGLMAGILVAMLAAGVLLVGKRQYIRSRFVKTRPDRSNWD